MATHAADSLPTQYVKLYHDAAQLVDQLNSRIPKVLSIPLSCVVMGSDYDPHTVGTLR